MDAQTIAAPAVAETHKAEITYPRLDQLSRLADLFGTASLDLIEEQCRILVQDTAAAAMLALGLRLIYLKEMVGHGEWLLTLGRIGIQRSFSSRAMQAAYRLSALPDNNHLLIAAKSKSKLIELLVLDDSELAKINQGEAVRGVSLTTLPKISVSVLRSTLKDNAPGKYGVNDAFADIASPFPPTAEPVLGKRASTHELAEVEANVTSTAHLEKRASTPDLEDPTDYPAVYALLPGDYNGWPVSLIRHEGKTWLIAHEVAAILAQNGDELAEIQAILAEWHAIDTPAGSLRKIRLASMSTVLLVIDAHVVEMLDVRLDTPASAALAAWCSDFDTAPALAEVTALHEAPAEKTTADYLGKLEVDYDQAHLMLHNLVSQIRGIHELSELACGKQTKLSICDMAGMLGVARGLVEDYERRFEGLEDGLIDLSRTLKSEHAIHA